jgi:hypothetical protein
VTGARNVRGGIVLLGFGLAAGLAMSLYAFKPLVPVPESLAHYDDLPRRLFRLSHIAAIMLPIINIVLGAWLDRLRLPPAARMLASWLLLTGGIGLPIALALEGLVPPLIDLHLSAAPAIAFCAGVFLAAAAALRGDLHASP